MRINLKTPFAEKDAVKALGARWDAAQKLWYIVDVADLTPFLRWIPNGDAAHASPEATAPQASPGRAPPPRTQAPPKAKAGNDVPHCGCDVLPWQDCAHSAKP
jgi:hypothetical protein